ncbi:MAG: hypothetical protein LBG23_02500 [Endomicrobium sp.]|nr:hypothetical protein [Endomicrobium sp.]
MVVNNPVIDDAIYVSAYDVNSKMSIKLKMQKLVCFFRNVLRVFFKKFDIIFIFDSAKASILLAKLSRIPKIVGGDLLFVGNDIKDQVFKYYH